MTYTQLDSTDWLITGGDRVPQTVEDYWASMGFYASIKLLGKQSTNKRSNKIVKYIDIADMFILKMQIVLF